MATPKGQGKYTKKHKTVDAVILLETAEKLGVTPHALSLDIGYSGGSAAAWVKSGKMPAVAGLACEALVRRRGDNGASVGEHYIVVHLVDTRVVGTRVITKPSKMHLNGQNYLLVPEV
jgi:hypothetical protein